MGRVQLCMTLAASLVAVVLLQPAVHAATMAGTGIPTVTTTGSGYKACDPSVRQITGFVNMPIADNRSSGAVRGAEKHYFFWFFEAKSAPSTAPLTLWMSGGPGCTGGMAALSENGPCLANNTNGDIYSNPYSWNNVANVLYVDQPAGVGFSYTDSPAGYDGNEVQVATDMANFMRGFYSAFPQYQGNPLFVFGESYGGHYAPATAHQLFTAAGIPVAGVGIGNGLTQPSVQYASLAEYAFDWCTVVRGEPCITQQQYETQLEALPKCLSLIDQCNAPQASTTAECVEALNVCSQSQSLPMEMSNISAMDIRKPCPESMCYGELFNGVTKFMNRPDVQHEFGVASRNVSWLPCAMKHMSLFNADQMRDFSPLLGDLLNAGVRVLVYNGDMDFLCNWIGGKNWTLQLEWRGKDAFNAAPDASWWVDEMPAGRVRVVGNATAGVNNQLTFMQVHDAGHMVPMDQPRRALALLEAFIHDTPFPGVGIAGKV